MEGTVVSLKKNAVVIFCFAQIFLGQKPKPKPNEPFSLFIFPRSHYILVPENPLILSSKYPKDY